MYKLVITHNEYATSDQRGKINPFSLREDTASGIEVSSVSYGSQPSIERILDKHNRGDVTQRAGVYDLAK